MEEMPEPPNSPEEKSAPDVESLLQEIDAQLLLKRLQREQNESKQMTVRVYGLAVIVIGAMVALGMLYYLLKSLPRERLHSPEQPALTQ